MSNAINIENQGSVMIVTFVCPEVRNPMSIRVIDELNELISNLSSGVLRLIFTGTEGVFASGADLREISMVDGSTARAFAMRGQKLMASIADLSTLTIAAVNGHCYGGALDLALSCKIRIASPNAEFCHPGAGLGIMTGWGGTQRLPRLVGEATALEMFLTSKRLNSQEAFEVGLVDAVAESPVGEALNYQPLLPSI